MDEGEGCPRGPGGAFLSSVSLEALKDFIFVSTEALDGIGL